MKPATTGHLSTKLSDYERWLIGRLYKENIGLIKQAQDRYIKRYPMIDPVEIHSCVDIAFVKAARIWKPSKGKLSTIFYEHVNGEISHFRRTGACWGFHAERRIREIGLKARGMIAHRHIPMWLLPDVLQCTREELVLALEATTVQSSLDELRETSEMTETEEVWAH